MLVSFCVFDSWTAVYRPLAVAYCAAARISRFYLIGIEYGRMLLVIGRLIDMLA